MKQVLACLVTVLVLAGCGTTVGTSPRTSQSGFDNAKVVSIDPHGTACRGLPCISLGAQWQQAKPSTVLLIMQITGEYKAITGAELNIDGEKLTLNPSGDITAYSAPGSIYRASSRPYVVPLSTIDRIIAAKRVWIRLGTPTGTIENAIIDGETDSKAYHALKRFMATVRAS